MKIKECMCRNRVYLFLMVTIVFVLSLPFLQRGLYYGHDLGFHLQRISSMEEAISRGEFPVRIYKELYDGYGYGAPIFYPCLFLYLPAMLCHFGLSVSMSYKVFVLAVNILTMAASFAAYTGLSQSRKIGFFAAALYTTATYRLVDLYIRASVGEYLAIAFLPLYLLGLLKVVEGKETYWVLLAIAATCVLQSHILTFLLMILMSLLYVLIRLPRLKEGKVWRGLLLAAGSALLLNLWFLVPFLEGYRLPLSLGLADESFAYTGISLFQLFDVAQLGASEAEEVGEIAITKTPGLLILAGVFFLLYVLLCRRTSLGETVRRYPLPAALGLVGICFLMLSLDLFPWEKVVQIPLLGDFFRRFQYIWRMNTITVLALALPGAYGFAALLGTNRHGALILTVLALVSTLLYQNQYLQGQIQLDTEPYMDSLYLTVDNTIDTRRELESNVEGIAYGDYVRGDSEVTLRFSIPEAWEEREPAYIDVPIAYYPGYVAYVDGAKQDTQLSPAGVVRVVLTQDTGLLQVRYEEKPLYRLCDWISLASLVAFCALSLGRKGLRRTSCPEGK